MGRVKIVSASAGSGKTYNLAMAYVRNVICDPAQYRHIVAVTFTNKATEEMKQRILLQLNCLSDDTDTELMERVCNDTGLDIKSVRNRAVKARNLILHDYNNFSVLTIDKFFQRIIRSFVKELNLDVNFNLELQTDSLLGSAADKLIDDISTDDELREWFMGYIDEKIGLSDKWNVKDGLIELGKELYKEEYKKIATHCSEVSKQKLKTIVYQRQTKADKAKEKCKILAESFIEIATANGLEDGDFNQGTRGVLAYAKSVAKGLLLQPNSYVCMALNDGKWAKRNSPKCDTINCLSSRFDSILRQTIEAVNMATACVNSAALITKHYRNFALISDLRHKADDICRTENIVPISEINNIISELISGNDSPFIFEKVGNYFNQFMIDEFQDTSSMQWKNFLPLFKNALSESESSPVMLVGDVKQSIYRWRGGDWGILGHDVYNEFTEIESEVLNKNYRSLHTVVEFNNNIIGRCAEIINSSSNNDLSDAFGKRYIAAEVKDELTDIIFRAYKNLVQTSKDDSNRGYVTILTYKKDVDAVHPVICKVEELQSRGYRPNEIAILVRTNPQAREIAGLLLDYKHSHPESPYSYDVVTQEALSIGSSDICAFVICCFRLAVNCNDTITRAAFNHLNGNGFECELSEDDECFFSRIGLKSPEEAFEEIVMRYGLGERTVEVSYLQALHEQIMDFCSSKIADINLFLEWWDETGSKQSIAMPRETSAITIATIHKSKGLGFKTVIIPFCDWGLKTMSDTIIWSRDSEIEQDAFFPIGYAKSMAESSFSEDYYRETVLAYVDSLNTLYVAFTRAQEELHIMIPSSLNGIGKIVFNSMDIRENEVRIDKITGTATISDEGVSLTFGTPEIKKHAPTMYMPYKIGFQSFPIEERVAVKYSFERYVEDNPNSNLYPRQYGILMHKVLENANCVDDIIKSVNMLCIAGDISEHEKDTLRKTIEETFSNGDICSWFSKNWQIVKNENDIITPEGRHYRPDRVMIDGNKAIVVDYKFGLSENPKHVRQVEEYMNLLNEMGYAEVKGFVWYIGLNRLVNIDM